MKHFPVLMLTLALFAPATVNAGFDGHYLCKAEKDAPADSVRHVSISTLTIGLEKVPFVTISYSAKVDNKYYELETRGIATVLSRKSPGAPTIETLALYPDSRYLPAFVDGEMYSGGEFPGGGSGSYCQKL